MSKWRVVVLCLLQAFLVAGCNVQTTGDELQFASAAPPPARGSFGPYILGPGDKVRIKVYDDANISGEYEVSGSGNISVPLVGQIRAAGLTTTQLEQAIVARMKGKIAHDPKVNIDVVNYAPFYVHGEVKKAGAFPFQPGMTVADAVATAGGLTYRANENSIVLQRAGTIGSITVPIDGSVPVFPGDNIRVAERYF